MEKKNRKPLIALLVVVIIGVIGFTLAYFSDSITIGNEFKTKKYGTSVTEVFVSPDNWTPGTTTEKSVVATNTGNVDEAVRISYTEKWVAANETTELSGWVDENGNVTDHESGLATDERAALINFDNASDWTLNDGYYYYNYKLAPTESTSSFIKSVTFNSIVQSDSDCEETSENGTKTITCTSTGEGYDGATYTLTFTIETVQYDQYKNAWNTSFDIASEKPKTGVQTLLENVNEVDATYSNDTKGEMFAFTHGEETEYRYIGDSPNNYVKFNCDENGENCEIWRIVGIFNVDDGTDNKEQRMKLVRGELLPTEEGVDENGKWDSNYVNEWSTATLKTYLNGTYFNDELTESAKSMIGNAKYYLGGRKWADENPHYGSTEDMYAWERGTEVYNESRTTEWTGKVALLYPSDYGYTYAKEVDSTCYGDPYNCDEGTPTKGWIYNSNKREGATSSQCTWLLSPRADLSGGAFCVDSSGYVCYVNGVDDSLAVRPVVYLTSDIKIDEGTGEVGNPYTLTK